MNNVERIELFKTSLQPEALMPAFQELLDDKAALGALLQEELSGFASTPSRLSDASERRLLSCLFLLSGMGGFQELFPTVLGIVLSKEFGENVGRDEWLSSEISRLLCVLSPATGAKEHLLAPLLDASTPLVISEQLLLTLSCRWISRRDNDESFLATMRRFLTEIPSSAVTFEIAMALMVNAVAVGGDALKPQVYAFYKANEELLSDRLAEKTLQSFFDLGKQRIKSMLSTNYLGGYGPLPGELDRMLNYVDASKEEEEVAAMPTLPPITRDAPKIGRNDPCPCGSGKKYKKCCGK